MPLERGGHGARDEISRARRATSGAVRPDRARCAGRRSEVTHSSVIVFCFSSAFGLQLKLLVYMPWLRVKVAEKNLSRAFGLRLRLLVHIYMHWLYTGKTVGGRFAPFYGRGVSIISTNHCIFHWLLVYSLPGELVYVIRINAFASDVHSTAVLSAENLINPF